MESPRFMTHLDWIEENAAILRPYLGKWVAVPRKEPFRVLAVGVSLFDLSQQIAPEEPTPFLFRVSEPHSDF